MISALRPYYSKKYFSDDWIFIILSKKESTEFNNLSVIIEKAKIIIIVSLVSIKFKHSIVMQVEPSNKKYKRIQAFVEILTLFENACGRSKTLFVYSAAVKTLSGIVFLGAINWMSGSHLEAIGINVRHELEHFNHRESILPYFFRSFPIPFGRIVFFFLHWPTSTNLAESEQQKKRKTHESWKTNWFCLWPPSGRLLTAIKMGCFDE